MVMENEIYAYHIDKDWSTCNFNILPVKISEAFLDWTTLRVLHMERCTFLLPLTTAGEGESSFIYITLTFMYMADVFTQSSLHCIISSCIHWESNPGPCRG